MASNTADDIKQKAVISISKFSPDPFGHGGYKRAAQINELLVSHDIKIFYLSDLKFEKRPIRDKFATKIFAIKLVIKERRLFNLRNLRKDLRGIDSFYYRLTYLIEQNKDYDISAIIWENTIPKLWYMSHVVKNIEVKIIAFPHNLESFVPNQLSHRRATLTSPYWLDEEVSYLKECDHIVCISREERWLLSVLIAGDKVSYLPYFPSKPMMDKLASIKAKRIKLGTKNSVVMLGSASNIPTQIGLTRIKNMLLKQPFSEYSYEFVGYKMWKINQDQSELPNHIKISSDVSNEYLENVLVNAKCVVVYQVPTSGALTRLKEMQLAGIPVIVNSDGARSYFNEPGIIVIEDLSELFAAISNISEQEIFHHTHNNSQFSSLTIQKIFA